MLKLVCLSLPIFLIAGFAGCKRTSPREQAKSLINEANKLIAQDSEVIGQWADEYKKAFNQENLKQFPANRESLRTHADRVMALCDQSSSLNRMAAEKFDQASKLLDNEQERKGVALFASAMRTSIEVNQLLKSQMKLVYDEEIKDYKTFDEKLKRSWQLIQEKRRESQAQIDQGRRIWGI